MPSILRIKQLTLLLGDIITYYCALFILLVIRYGYLSHDYTRFFNLHVIAFTELLPLWIIIFYIAGLYDLNALKNNELFNKKFWGALTTVTIASIAYFYFVPAMIAPKTNLLIFVVVIAGIFYTWRYTYNGLIGLAHSKERLLLIGAGPITEELKNAIQQNPQLGYMISLTLKDGITMTGDELKALLREHQIKTIVIPSHLKKERNVARIIYHELAMGRTIIDVESLYERIFHKVPLAETGEVWFLENIAEHRRLYTTIIAPAEKLFAFVLSVALIPLWIIISLAIKLTSRGSIVFAQTRIGKYGKSFTLYKFRSMRTNAEINGPQWAKENDPRTTFVGSILRKTHLDELPQLWNIMKGEISFVGPRPERPEFVTELKNKIPYYELRHLTNPGITGWAQINYRYGRSIEDAYEKLQYDLYYLKERSFTLDIAIVLRTIKLLLIHTS